MIPWKITRRPFAPAFFSLPSFCTVLRYSTFHTLLVVLSFNFLFHFSISAGIHFLFRDFLLFYIFDKWSHLETLFPRRPTALALVCLPVFFTDVPLVEPFRDALFPKTYDFLTPFCISKFSIVPCASDVIRDTYLLAICCSGTFSLCSISEAIRRHLAPVTFIITWKPFSPCLSTRNKEVFTRWRSR